MNLQKTIQDSLQAIITQRVLFACSAITKQHEIDNSIDTAATDGKKIVYNEQFFWSLDYQVRITLICHELLHILLGHHLRMRGKDSELWNVACDYVINLILVDMGFAPIDGWLFDSQYKGKSAEDVYTILKKQEKDKQEKQINQSKQSGGNFEEPKNTQGNQLSDSELEEEKVKAELEAREAKSQLNRRMKGIEKSDTLTEQSKKQLLDEIGKGSGGFVERLEDIKHSRINWKSVISEFLFDASQSSEDEETFDPYAMEANNFDIVYHDRYSKEFGQVAFCMDVSGSLSYMAKDVCSEAFYALEQVQKGELLTYYVSTRIERKEVITNPEQLATVSGGRTNFDCFFNRECLEDDFEAEGIIFVTDGCVNPSNWIEPPCKVLWILTSANSWFEKNVPFGECVRMS